MSESSGDSFLTKWERVIKGNHKAVRLCPACRKSGFTLSASATGRPQFTCQGCGHVWTSGNSGAPYLGGEQSPVLE